MPHPPASGVDLAQATVLLATAMRGPEPDTLHHGAACLVHAGGRLLWSAGDAQARTFMRSSAKPLQALPILACGAAERFRFDARDLAIICGSHTGGEEQAAQVRGILAKAGLAEDLLQCGDGVTDMCSGKHAGMLAACKHLGLPAESYLDAGHPLQAGILAALADTCLLSPQEIGLAMDGCSAPTFSLPLYNMALGFARMAAQGAASSAGRLFQSMLDNPGGHTGEPDMRAFRVGGNLVVTKAGAGGLFCAAIPGADIGFALKIADGSPLPRWPVFIGALERAGFLTGDQARPMRLFLCPPILTRRKEPVGEIRLSF